MARFKLNFNTITDLLGSGAISIIRDWAKQYPNADMMFDYNFVLARYLENGRYVYAGGTPYNNGGSINHRGSYSKSHPTVRLITLKSRPNDGRVDDYENIHYIYDFAFAWLGAPTPKYSCYNVKFAESGLQLTDWNKSFMPFWLGYIGITGRNPLVRFEEHRRDMLKGVGYHFHSSWRALLGVDSRISPTFTLLQKANTLDDIYDIEESLVGEYTLAPKGLNAIPGGRAGMRMLHLLRSGDRLPSLEERDAAFVDLEHGRHKSSAFFRRGHIRKLPAACSKDTTWVNPHWVNLDQAAA